jgi:hypothetical protein
LGTSGRKEAWRKARQRYAHNVGRGLSAEEEIIDVTGCRWGSLELRILQIHFGVSLNFWKLFPGWTRRREVGKIGVRERQ